MFCRVVPSLVECIEFLFATEEMFRAVAKAGGSDFDGTGGSRARCRRIGRQNWDLAERVLYDARLARENPEQVLIAGVGQDKVMQPTERPATQKAGNTGFRLVVEQDRDQSAVPFGIIDII